MFSIFIVIHRPHTLQWDRRLGGFGGSSERLVGGEDLVHPAAELGDAGVDGGRGGGAAAASPGDDADQSPGVVVLAHQGAARVALQPHSSTTKPVPGSGAEEAAARRAECQTGSGRGLTMQEVAPAAPAQIITLETWLPQVLLHCSLDIRGRAACCSLLGVPGAVGDTHQDSLPAALSE